jgi:hypothetical protein
MGRGSALVIALLVVAGLGLLALWPTPAWAPPLRPRLSAPIVFDEFVNPPSPAPVESNAPDPTAQ